MVDVRIEGLFIPLVQMPTVIIFQSFFIGIKGPKQKSRFENKMIAKCVA
jgi:hypothetical protein